MTRIETCKRIVTEHRAEEIDGMLLDVQTAHVLTKVWDAFGEKSRNSFETIPLDKLVTFAWKQVQQA